MSDRETMELVQAFLEGTLSADDERNLVRVLKEYPALASEVRCQAAMDALLRMKQGSLPERAGLKKSIGEEIAQVRTGSAPHPRAAGPRLSGKKRSVYRLAWLSVAACLAIIVGSVLYNMRQSGKMADVMIGRIASVSGVVEIERTGNIIVVRVEVPVMFGDTVRTSSGASGQLRYEGEESSVDIMSDTDVEFRGEGGAKQVTLRKGAIRCDIAPQPKGAEMVVTTPQAQAEVKGTVFSLAVSGTGNTGSTRLEVTEGVVAFTRLSDGESIDVAVGQYAVAQEHVELAALPLPGTGAETPPNTPPAPATDGVRKIARDEAPAARTHLDGEVLLQTTDFTGYEKDWEVVSGNMIKGFRPVPAGESLRVKAAAEEERGMTKHPYLSIDSPCLGRERDTPELVQFCLRSRKRIAAERFVVEIFCCPTVGYYYLRGLEIEEVVPIEGVGPSHHFSAGYQWFRWEFTPDEGGTLLCRVFKAHPQPGRKPRWAQYRYTDRVSSSNRRVLIGMEGTMDVFSVTVKELREEPGAGGEGR